MIIRIQPVRIRESTRHHIIIFKAKLFVVLTPSLVAVLSGADPKAKSSRGVPEQHSSAISCPPLTPDTYQTHSYERGHFLRDAAIGE